jgi:hypothetical protein
VLFRSFTVNNRSVMLAKELVAARFAEAAPRLGDVVLRAMKAYAAAYGGDETLERYGIMGDPGLLLR